MNSCSELTALIRIEDLRMAILGVSASRTAFRQKSVVSVLDSHQASTRRLAQSRMTHRYTKPRRIGMYVISAAQT